MPTRSKAQVLRVPEDGEPLRSWAGPTEAAVTASRFSHGSSAAFPNIVQSFKERLIVKNDTPNQGGFLLPVLGHRDLQHLPRYSYLSSSNTLHRTHLHPH